jgi:hypothetical protein
MAFRQSNSSFADISVDKRLDGIDSFLLQIDNVIDFERLRPILSKNGIGTKNTCGNKAYELVNTVHEANTLQGISTIHA